MGSDGESLSNERVRTSGALYSDIRAAVLKVLPSLDASSHQHHSQQSQQPFLSHKVREMRALLRWKLTPDPF